MNKGMKILLVILLGAYVVSPIDLMPGSPVDDLIILLLTFISSRRIGQRQSVENID